MGEGFELLPMLVSYLIILSTITRRYAMPAFFSEREREVSDYRSKNSHLGVEAQWEAARRCPSRTEDCRGEVRLRVIYSVRSSGFADQVVLCD